jgi:RNA recognition motif-containing protein
MVTVTNAEKARLAKLRSSLSPNCLKVSGFPLIYTEDDLKQLFTPFGEIDFLHMESPGTALIQFKYLENCKDAIDNLNGFVLSGRVIKVEFANEARSASEPNEGPTRTILLKNMFDPAQESEDDWPSDIREDVIEECSKYGQVLHCYVEKDSMGHVYVKFETANAAQGAHSSLNGRWFAGKQISVEYLPESFYSNRFPQS